jgi:energy-coupling factor transport system substrate-specific component
VENKLISVKTLLVIIIGAGLMFVLMRFASIETKVESTYINFGIAILAAFAAAFGPIVGFVIGFIGHTLTDVVAPWPVSWSWVISSAIFGGIIGWFWKSFKIEEGEFGLKECLRFNGIQIIANIVVWAFIARTLDMSIFKESFSKVSQQGFAAAGFNSAVVLVFGSLLCFCYSKYKSRKK